MKAKTSKRPKAARRRGFTNADGLRALLAIKAAPDVLTNDQLLKIDAITREDRQLALGLLTKSGADLSNNEIINTGRRAGERSGHRCGDTRVSNGACSAFHVVAPLLVQDNKV